MNKIPLIFFLLLTGFLAALLLRSWDSTGVESALVGRPAPAFHLPGEFKKGGSFSSEDLQGEPSIVNVFASSCPMCRIEQGILEEIGREENVPVYGLNYKDTPDKLAAWLEKYGDPYDAIGADRDGRVAIDWGVQAVPETFLVDARGVIRYRHAGAVTDDDYRNIFKPLLAEMRR